MKHLYCLSLLLLAILLPATAFAHDFEVDGIYYYIKNSSEVTVTYKGAFYNEYNEYSGSVTIPSSVIYNGTTYSVTTIGGSAFYACSGLTTVTIPNSVTSIGNGAFRGCTGLTSVNIPNSVTTIGVSVFMGCRGLTSIDIPNSVTFIGDEAFFGCSGLTSITISNSVTTIGVRAFRGCSGLTSITIPNSVTTISEFAFYGCSGLTSITIPNSVTTIGICAFQSCNGLTSIDIPNSVTSIGAGAFHGTQWYDNQPDGVVYAGIVAYVYKGTMPSGTRITLRNGTLVIAGSAFNECSGLTSIDIPNSVISIGSSAFNRCTDLTEIYSLALTPPTVYYNTFSGCYGATLFVPVEAYEAYKQAEYWKRFNIACIGAETPGAIFKVDGIHYRTTSMNTASVIANNDEATLYSGDVVIPDSVTYEGMTFAVTGIESNAFDGCFELTSITIPNSVADIGEQAFQGCTGLKNVTIGSGVTSIGAKAFNYCNALVTVKCYGTVPPVMASIDCFSTAAYNRATLLVPRQFVDAYTAADYWYKFAHIEGWGSAGRGDIDGDGLVNISDVTVLIDILLGSKTTPSSADVDGDGTVNIADVTTLIDMLLNDIE